MRDDFDKEGMREKIRTNQAKGFTISEIKFLLLKEKMDLLRSIGVSEARAAQLSDQIEFIEEEYG